MFGFAVQGIVWIEKTPKVLSADPNWMACHRFQSGKLTRWKWQENEGRRIRRTPHSSAPILLPTDWIEIHGLSNRSTTLSIAVPNWVEENDRCIHLKTVPSNLVSRLFKAELCNARHPYDCGFVSPIKRIPNSRSCFGLTSDGAPIIKSSAF